MAAAAAAALLRGVGFVGELGAGAGGGVASDGKVRGSGGASQENQGSIVVAFTGGSGAGKACLAAEVIGRRDVRARFADAVVWLQVSKTLKENGKMEIWRK